MKQKIIQKSRYNREKLSKNVRINNGKLKVLFVDEFSAVCDFTEIFCVFFSCSLVFAAASLIDEILLALHKSSSQQTHEQLL